MAASSIIHLTDSELRQIKRPPCAHLHGHIASVLLALTVLSRRYKSLEKLLIKFLLDGFRIGANLLATLPIKLTTLKEGYIPNAGSGHRHHQE